VAHSTDSLYWQQFCSWKSDQSLRTNVTNIFWVRWVERVLEQVRDAQQRKDFSGLFSLLFAGPHLVAAHFGMRSGPLLHSWFPAYDPLFSTCSPGLLLLMKLFEAAPELGITKVDLGKGMYEWKQRFMNASEDVASGSVELLSIPTLRRIARRKASQISKQIRSRGVAAS
jgi:CelD/BcsL family acetyltransferase involved in cellulose biosynthesis